MYKSQDLKVKCVALINDTVGCLMSCAFHNHETYIGVIIGGRFTLVVWYPPPALTEGTETHATVANYEDYSSWGREIPPLHWRWGVGCSLPGKIAKTIKFVAYFCVYFCYSFFLHFCYL